MKKIFNSVVTMLVLLITGCAEQLPVDPVSNVSLPKHGFGKIEICCEVQDTYSGVCQLNGVLTYTHQIVPAFASVTGSHTIRLTLDINAVLCDRLGMVHPSWQVKDYCEEELFISEDGIRILEKVYVVSNRKDININVTYIVSTDGVVISKIGIVPADKL